MRQRRRNRGQATLEYVILLGTVILPLTFGLITLAQLLWTYHSVVELTRMGARYAATHCWQPSGENVRNWMRQNAPLMLDRDAIVNGSAELRIEYFRKDPDSGALIEFTCETGECSPACIPDVVTVRVANYEFRQFITTYLGLPPVQMPDFATTVPIEGAGCDPEQGTCTP